MSTVDEQLQGPPTIKTLEQKIKELTNTFAEFGNTYRKTRKTVIQQLGEIRQLAMDLKIDDIKLREMICGSFALMGVSESWIRKLLPESLKSTKHTRKDYLKLQEQRDKQLLLQQLQQQQQHELAKLSTQSVSAQRLSDGKTTSTACYDNKAVRIASQTQKEGGEGLPEQVDKHTVIIIEKLKQRIEELEKENRHLRETASQHQGQQQQQEDERFTAHGILQLKNNEVPVRVRVNVKTKTIEYMELAMTSNT
jgi:hypothetical protein